MKFTPHTGAEAAALEAARGKPLPAGWKDGAVIRTAVGGFSANNNEMTILTIAVPDGSGGERLIKDWITDSPHVAPRLRHLCEAIGLIDRYEAGEEIEPEEFEGHTTVRVKLAVERRGKYPARNVITDYAKSDARAVTHLRGVAS